MKISGFSFIRNADKLFYPVKESIQSILPIVDEFVIAVGNNDDGDSTIKIIESINSPKIKIIHTVWDTEKYPKAMVYAQQTDVAKQHCTGDWLFYIQGDEVLHENGYDHIVNRCAQFINTNNVEGFILKYYHFWGDYEHYNLSHGSYAKEVRIIRNLPDIHSYKDAQSFRRIPNFDGLNYRQENDTYKLKVAAIDAHIYHYGWVRPPDYMMRKKKTQNTFFQGAEKSDILNKDKVFDYGPLKKVHYFNGTHPAIMQQRIQEFDWADQLDYSSHKRQLNRPLMKHEKLKYRALSWVENTIMKKQIFAFKNYELLDV